MYRNLESFLDIRFLNNGFFITSIFILLFIPANLLFVSKKGRIETLPANLIPAVSVIHLDPKEPVAVYEENFKKNTVFGLFSTETNVSVSKAPISELLKDYRLKGVVIYDTPEAIIQDAKTQKSIFVKAGDMLGELSVKEVKEGSVVFSAYGQDKEMRIE